MIPRCKAGYTTANAGSAGTVQKVLARRGWSIHIVLFEQQGSDETHDGVVIREDADDIGAPLDLPVKAFDRIRNRYKIPGAEVRLRISCPWRMVRPSGTEAPGARRCGQADAHDELRARVSSWPPLRLARLRRERGSVVVVWPTCSRNCST